MGQPAAAPLPSTSAESARVRSETAPEAEGSPPPSPAPQQLFVLVHGICGHARDFEVWEERLRACERPDWVVRISEKITPHAKFAGSEVCKLGEMLAGEVIDWVKELHIQAGIVVHFVCHSLGGLVARAALPKICEELDDELPSVSYGHFITLNTPHLGVRGANLWMCWKNMGVLIPTAAFSQIHQLTLQDRSGETPSSETLRSEPSSSSVTTTSAAQKPSRRFLESLADPQGRWCEALARFKYRTAVAASHWDVIVPFCTAAICSDNPFPSPNIFAGDFRTFWRVDAAVGFEAGSPLAKKNAEGGQVALEFEKSLSRPPVAAEGVEVSSSDEAPSSGSEDARSAAPSSRRSEKRRWLHSSDREVEFTAAMLDGMNAGPPWRRIVYTLHQPWVNADVHLFTIGKDRKVIDWSKQFIDLLISMLSEPELQQKSRP